MTARLPFGCLYAVTSITTNQYASSRLISSGPTILVTLAQNRHYAKHRPKQPALRQVSQAVNTTAAAPPALPQPDAVKSAFEIISANAKSDPINPPRSTIPPPLNLPEKGDENGLVYLYRLGRAYGTFYKDGIKAVWFNRKASKLLRERLQEAGVKDTTTAVKNGQITRSEFQLLMRNDHDIGKLPLFSLLVLVFGEWLVLLVPFIPNAVPGTCRIPKQVEKMRAQAEARRQQSFRRGIAEPLTDQWTDGANSTAKSLPQWPVAFDGEYLDDIVKHLQSDQLYHLSCTLGLHKHIWDRLQLPPPSFLLRSAISKHLRYLAQDDLLLTNSETAGSNRNVKQEQHLHSIAGSMSSDELRIAVSERGVDVLGCSDDQLRKALVRWLAPQAKDGGRGRAMLGSLFGRLVMREWVKLNLDADHHE